jgi:hypothetical protein
MILIVASLTFTALSILTVPVNDKFYNLEDRDSGRTLCILLRRGFLLMPQTSLTFFTSVSSVYFVIVQRGNTTLRIYHGVVPKLH